MERIFRKADIALIVLLVLFAGAFYFIFRIPGAPGNSVTVSVSGELYRTLPLSEDAVLEILLPDGAHANTLTISGGSAYMSYADCPDEICLHHAPVRLSGEMIVCLPNRVIVTVSGADSGLDAIVE